MTERKRIVAIIDGSNLFVALRKRQMPTRLHYTNLCIHIAKQLPQKLQPWAFKQCIYNTSSPRQSDNPKKYQHWLEFYDMLQKTSRMEVKLGRLEGPVGQVREKGVDINITNDILGKAYKNEYDILILVTGDGDYASTLKLVKDMGKKVYVSFFSDAQSYHLSQNANGFIALPNDQKRMKRFLFYQYK